MPCLRYLPRSVLKHLLASSSSFPVLYSWVFSSDPWLGHSMFFTVHDFLVFRLPPPSPSSPFFPGTETSYLTPNHIACSPCSLLTTTVSLIPTLYLGREPSWDRWRVLSHQVTADVLDIASRSEEIGVLLGMILVCVCRKIWQLNMLKWITAFSIQSCLFVKDNKSAKHKHFINQ